MAEAIRGAAAGAIVRADDGTLRQSYIFDEKFLGFSGHFPGRPILPAVLQIMAASLLVAAAAGEPLLPVSVERAKFVTPILPGMTVEITCRPRGGAATGTWEVRIDSRSRTAASFTLELRAPAAAA
jgi:3-hydroxyacyl-[acyl-carrier-protein] dehydratase